jgi:hypothetical protein
MKGQSLCFSFMCDNIINISIKIFYDGCIYVIEPKKFNQWIKKNNIIPIIKYFFRIDISITFYGIIQK